jgi:hypothetical protein
VSTREAAWESQKHGLRGRQAGQAQIYTQEEVEEQVKKGERQRGFEGEEGQEDVVKARCNYQV